MNDIYGLINEFMKLHPKRFWVSIVVFLFSATVIIYYVLKKKNMEKKKAEELQQTKEMEDKKVIDERLKRVKLKAELERQQKEKEKKKAAEDLLRKENEIKMNKTIEKGLAEKKVSNPTKEISNNPIISVKEPKSAYGVDMSTNKPTKPIDILPAVKEEKEKEITENLFVNYETNLLDSVDNYAVIRIPKKGCIVRSHRHGNTKRRGLKEEAFQESIEEYFGSHYIVSGEVRLNTGENTRPFEPDIAIIDSNTNKNIRVDIEIDEPYAGITRQPTHCKGDDLMRDIYFVDRGWVVIRFSEYQVHTQEMSCLKFIAKFLNNIDSKFSINNDFNTIPDLVSENTWDIVQAQKWEKSRYRENYLNHEFGEVEERIETIKRDFNKQEINEEKLVKSSVIGTVDNIKSTSFNAVNSYIRDKRIKFYPEPHIYTIDNVPAPSASTIISRFFPEFDAYSAALNLKPSNPLYGLAVNEIIKIWGDKGIEAANKGTYLHEQIEKYYLDEPIDETEEFHLFRQFISENSNIKPYRTEWRIFDEKFNIAGTIDLIAKNGQEYEIYDWKRSKKIMDTYTGLPINTDRWGKCGVGKLSDIPDTSFNRYCLQQSLYRYIIEKNYKIKISNMYLVVLYPDYNTYYKVPVPYWNDRIEYILDTL